MTQRDFHCEAYGPLEGSPCFWELIDPCQAAAQCQQRMAMERFALWVRMNELAASGDPLWVQLAEDFPHHSDLLGGRQDPEEA